MNKLNKWFKENITTDRIAIIILLLAIIGIFYLPHWVTQKSWKYDLGETESNEIADTIGGILGPFIGLISAFLVYLALREQVKANRLINYQFVQEKVDKSEREIFDYCISKIEVYNKFIKGYFFSESQISYDNYQYPEKKENFFELLIEELGIKGVPSYNIDETNHTRFEHVEQLTKTVTFFTSHVKEEDSFKIIFLENLNFMSIHLSGILEEILIQNENDKYILTQSNCYEVRYILAFIHSYISLVKTLKSRSYIKIDNKVKMYNSIGLKLNTFLKEEDHLEIFNSN